MAGRPRGFDRDEAIDQLVEIFWDRGFEPASIDELQRAIGVKRGSFYAAFGDKEAAFREALKRYRQSVAAKGLASLENHDNPRAGLAEFVRGIGQFMGENINRGCLLCTSAIEAPAADRGGARAVKAEAAVIEKALRSAVGATEKAGQLRSGETADALHAYLFTILFGLNAMARSGAAPEAINAAAEMAAANLDPH